MHCTLSFNPDSDDINFHIAKHADDENDKPKIVVALANKKVLENELVKFSKRIFQLAFEPVILINPGSFLKPAVGHFVSIFH